ncbi:TPA: hypothetical protein MIU67_01675 [Klebsiella pneumoniae]|nr:hypothetical protein DMQ64_12375 [Klebsiella pneumoniae]RDG57862.1 hypothetical protein DWA37_26400 [Klebsiella pneumoniae]HBY4486368.1 hypothetical protein [Klebsiella pneumoniae]HBY7059059.1 hypothetical protein [Klebsiella pneumoniae]
MPVTGFFFAIFQNIFQPVGASHGLFFLGGMKKMYIRSIKTTVHPCKNIILSLSFYLLILTCVPQMIAMQ